jgi:hypothetical protein
MQIDSAKQTEYHVVQGEMEVLDIHEPRGTVGQLRGERERREDPG